MKRTLLTIALLLIVATAANAYFDRLEAGGKALSMGKAFHALADDPSAVYWNPAGLAWQRTPGILLTHFRPYVVEDLSVNYAAVAWPLPARFGTAAAAWHHTGLSGVVGEDVFSLGVGRIVPLPVVGDAGLGVTVKALRVSYSDFTDRETLERTGYGSQVKWTADLGLLLQPSEKVRIGAVARNVGEPKFDFVESAAGGGTPIKAEYEGTVTFHWNEASLVSVGLAQDRDRNFAPLAGGEVIFYDVFALRSGLFDFEFWGGFGILTNSWTIDTGFFTHKDLGVSYMASITVPIGGER